MKETKDYNNILDALSDLTIDISAITKKISKVPQEVDFDNLEDIEGNYNINNTIYNEFAIIINYIGTFAYNLYAEYYNKNVNSRYVSEKLIVLMNLTMEYRSKYHLDGYEYKIFQSILNSLIKTFTKINI